MTNPYFSSSFTKQPLVFSTIGVDGRPIDSTGFKIDQHRDAFVTYSFTTGGLIQAEINLEISPEGSSWSEISKYSDLADRSGNVSGIVPKGYFVRLNLVEGDVSLVNGQEVLL